MGLQTGVVRLVPLKVPGIPVPLRETEMRLAEIPTEANKVVRENGAGWELLAYWVCSGGADPNNVSAL